MESESDISKKTDSDFPRKLGDEITSECTKCSIADESGICIDLSGSLMDQSKGELDLSHANNHSSLDGSKMEMNVSHSANHETVDETTGKLDLDMSQSNNHTSVDDLVTPDKNKSENGFSVSTMKKDDSGIYSEKSPDATSMTKENSDVSLSESISESLDENLLLSASIPMETDTADIGIDMTNNSCSHNSDNNVITVDKTVESITVEEVLDSKAKLNDESVSDDAVGADNKVTSEPVDKSLSGDVKTVLDNAIDNSVTLTDETEEKDFLASDTFLKEGIKDESSTERSKNEETKDLQVNNDEPGMSCSDSKELEKKDSESLKRKESVDKDEVENKSECDNADEATNSEQKEKSQTEAKKAGEKRRTRRYVFHDGSSSSSSSSPSEDEVPAVRRRRARRNRLLDSDSDIDSDDDIGGDKKSSSESDDGVEESVPLTQYGPPKQKWRAMYDVREREMGYSFNKCENYFQKKVQGSLRMVQRFELQYKMDHHEGCVNALHFNRIGKKSL